MTHKQKYYENAAKTIIKNLEKRQMEGYYCATSEEAVKKAIELIPAGASVSMGGSETIVETGLRAELKNHDYTLINRMAGKTPEETRKIYGEICASDVFLMSTNAITIDGQLVNIDGRGNRVSFLCFGPQSVIILAGMNKVVSTVEEGINRTRNIAAPPNTVRLERKTPCAVTGVCGDCLAPDCICGQVVITRHSMVPNRIKVILIGEELGF